MIASAAIRWAAFLSPPILTEPSASDSNRVNTATNGRIIERRERMKGELGLRERERQRVRKREKKNEECEKGEMKRENDRRGERVRERVRQKG